MKVLVQNCRTQRWLRNHKEWAIDAKAAKVFETTEAALRYCKNHHIPATQIVLKFPEGRFDVKIPISDECRLVKKGKDPM
jgi:hypothetical protein